MIVIADAGVVISLAILDKLDLLETLYGDVYIPVEVWYEIEGVIDELQIPQARRFHSHVKNISTPNPFTGIMHSGEAEAACLYQELNADFLIIDDKQARIIAEQHGINCFGTLAVLLKAKSLNLIGSLRPFFGILLAHNRYYKKNLLNSLLVRFGEKPLDR
jgi:predicted nucleic acid-binding protein